jgi:predicted nucleotidyltransferase/antitoxin component of RelBE/YafQ-DinJ toxin-antitoxin module
MKDSNFIVRVDKGVKEKAKSVANRYGFSLSSLVNAFLIEIGETENIPIHLGTKARRLEKVQSPYPGYDEVFKEEGNLSFEQIRKLVTSILGKRPHVFSKVYLVGSYAKGSADKESDIDLLVYPTKEATIGDLGYLQYVLSERSKKEVDVIDGSSASKAFLASLNERKILLYETSDFKE